MKNLILFLPLIFLACQKTDIRQPKHFGAIGNVDQDYAKFRKGRGKPVKDTVVVTPPDTTTVDTVVIVPPPTVDPVPADTIVPLSWFLQSPVPLNQGAEGACAAFATAHARDIEYYYHNGSMPYFSPEYIYNQTKFSDCSGGTSMQRCLDLLVNKGVCLNQTMPFSDQNGCDQMPTSAQDLEASNYKIIGYTKLLIADRKQVKYYVSHNKPVIISVTADNSFFSAKAGFIWRVKVDGTLGHAVTITGYDDAKNAYKVISSWGTGWGDNGSSWIDYDLLPTVSGMYCYIIK
jgi:hypothetical protein